MQAVQEFLANHHGKIISALGTLLVCVSYVATGNSKVETFLASHGLYTAKSAPACQCHCGSPNCHCGGK